MNPSPFDYIRSIYTWIIFIAWTLLIIIVLYSICLPIQILIRKFDPQHRFLHYYACVWANGTFWLFPGWKVLVNGHEKIDRKKSYIFVANHQSLLDIQTIYTLWRQFRWIAKEVLFKIPFFGWGMALIGYIPLKRGNKDSITICMNIAKQKVLQNMPVLFFPEGTRSKDGEMLPFKHGAFTLAKETQTEIVPIVIDGTGTAIRKHSWILNRDVNIVIEVLDPISKDLISHQSVEELKETTRNRIMQRLNDIRKKQDVRHKSRIPRTQTQHLSNA